MHLLQRNPIVVALFKTTINDTKFYRECIKKARRNQNLYILVMATT